MFEDNLFQEALNDDLNSYDQFEQNNYHPEIIEYKDQQDEQMMKKNCIECHQQEPKLFQIELENDEERVDYKNLPKLIGNNFEKYLLQNENTIPKTKGLENFLNERKNRKNKKDKQISTKISDLRELCQSDLQSRRIFMIYIKKQFLIDLINSTKIENPLKYIDGISTYFATAILPDNMISSHIISSKKKITRKKL
ncbi:unnamed protein product [Paramecium pentaurelia]|uniref:Uncharacterized protein n=1 Tax=Paramecium pentaurelia TaxID=43138 RepID=A0A8S1XBH6_9CILI|nr:unnamed protein product [Paramecium pentaurelia]